MKKVNKDTWYYIGLFLGTSMILGWSYVLFFWLIPLIQGIVNSR